MTTAEREQQTWQVPEHSSSVTISEFVNSIKRNKGVFWTTLLTCLALGVIASLILPVKFAAGSEVLVEGTSGSGISPSPENILGELSIQNAVYPLSTQVELLQSQEVFLNALDQAGIARPKTLEDLQNLPQVSVRQKKESNIFILSVEGKDREQVRALALAYPNVFQSYSDNIKNNAAQRAEDFVTTRLAEEQAALVAAEAEFTAFKVSNQVVDSNSEQEFRLAQLSTTEQQLADARAAEGAANAALQQARQDLQTIPKIRERVIDGVTFSLLNDNRQQLNNLELNREGLLQVYLPTSSQVKEIDAQIKLKKAFIANLEKNSQPTIKEDNPEYDLAKRRISDGQANADAAVSRRQELERLAAARTARLNALANLTKDQREFERRVGLHTQTIVSMKELLNRVQLRNNSIKSSVQTLTPLVYSQQTQPNWAVNIAVALVVGIALAVVFSIIRDSSLDKVNNREEAFILSGHSNLSNIPDRSRSKHPIITNPQSNLAFESYRVLRSNIAVHARSHDLRSLTVTSTLRREGKSVIASNLAIAFVLNGQRTILVDADMRHPSLHTLFGLQDKPGLGDLLLGTAAVNDVLQSTTVEGLYVVTCGTIPANATEVMGSPRMQEIITMLSDQADMLVVDSPHVVGLADAPSLAAATDASILVWQSGKPNKNEFREAVANLEASSPAFLGFVSNRVSAKEAHLTKS